MIKVQNFRIFLKKKDNIIYKDIEQQRGKREERKRKRKNEKKKKRKTVYIIIDILRILSSILCNLYISYFILIIYYVLQQLGPLNFYFY